MSGSTEQRKIPFFGARKYAAGLVVELEELQARCAEAERQLKRIGALDVFQIEDRKAQVQREIEAMTARQELDRAEAHTALDKLAAQCDDAKKRFVETEDLAMLQEPASTTTGTR